MATVGFLQPQTYTVGNSPYAHGGGPYTLAVADVNGDGIPDVIAGIYGNDTLSVLLGNGDGTFQPQLTFPTGVGTYSYGLYSIAVADVNGDGKLDVISTNDLNSNVTVELGNGNGTFQSPIAFATGNEPNGDALGDLNGDGKLDIVTANSDSTVSVLIGNGDGTFQTQTAIHVGGVAISVALGDVNGDGKVDIVSANYNGTVSVLLGNGNGTF
jgi:hypothetical protein